MPIQRRAVVMVWDGMRPDQVDPEETPNLWSLAARGVRFSESHAVFPTVTRCNSASIATGRLPANHGIPGNSFYLPDALPGRPLNTGDHNDLERLRPLRGGRILFPPSLGERLKAEGGRTVVVGTGSPGASLLLHSEAATVGDVILNPAMFVGADAGAIEARFGPFPGRELPRTALNACFTRVITEMVLPEMAPELLYFWHTDPDGTTHARGVGHPDARQSIRDADANLGSIVAALDRLGLAGGTDVIVISDHGFSTIRGALDVAGELMKAGIKASPDSLDVVVTGGFVYVPSGDEAILHRVVQHLATLDGVGAIFTGARGDVVEGTLPMALLGAASAMAPDIMYSPAWDDEPNEWGVRGTVRGEGDGYAFHGSFSPWEVRNTLIAAGPSFRRGLVSDIPVATVDLAPTLAATMGLSPVDSDGRVMAEALAATDDPPAVERELMTAARPGFSQEAAIARVQGSTYVDYARRIR